MNGMVIMIISVLLMAVILFLITFIVLRRKKNNKYKQEIERLDVEKNMLIGASILSEISKVRELVKTDNLRNKLNNWDSIFKDIKEVEVPKLNDMITEADFLIDKKDYPAAIKKMAMVEIQINILKKKSESLLNEVRIITNSEERNRALITKLKIMFRELKSKFERSIKDYGTLEDIISSTFDSIDKKFQLFENAMDNNDYVGVEHVVIDIEESINQMKVILDETPSVLLMANALIPSKIEEANVMYARMIRDGYPLDYLNVEYNIKEIHNKVNVIMENLKKLEIGDATIELKTILEYFDSLFNDFDKEKESKDVFKQNGKILKQKIENVNKVVYDIYIQIDDIKLTYDLSDEEINKFSVLNRNLETINEDYKRLMNQGKGKTFAYSKLVAELDGLSLRLSRLQDDLDYQLRSITSMKDDEYRAKDQLATIQNLLKQSKNKLKDYKIPVIPNSYYMEMREAQEAIREIQKELDKKPIVIKILNIRVDTARDLVFKIFNKTNDMLKSVMISESVIVYGNRYRSSYPDVELGLNKASEMFNKGQYSLSFDTAIATLEKVDSDILRKITMD